MICLVAGYVCGTAHFIVSMKFVDASDLSGLPFVVFVSAICGFFGMQTTGWAIMAALNRRNRILFIYFGFIAIVLALTASLFFTIR